MVLPASLTEITLQGTYLKQDGSPEAGVQIKIYSDEFIKSVTDGVSVGPLNYDAVLNNAGYFECAVAATNDPDWVPVNFTYLIKIALSTGVTTFRLSVPYDTPGGIINLPTASPTVNGPEPTMYVLLNSANQDGGYGKIDPTTHKLSPTVIPAGGGNADGAFRGNYSSVGVYVAGDTVIDSSVTYGALQNSTNKTPASNPSFWQAYPDASGGGGGAVTSVFGRTGAVVGTKADVGLANVDNTADASKPISTAQQTALDLKAPLASPTFTGTVAGITKAMVGLGSVDNTSDAAKPISTATQIALNSKADLVGGLLPTSQLPTLAINEVFTVGSQAAMLALTAQRGDMAIRSDTTPASVYVLSADAPTILANWILISVGQVVSVNGQQNIVVLAKGDIGLGNVDNTSDANKPVSTAQQTALDGKQPLDTDLTTIAGLTATTDNFMVAAASAWASRTPGQAKTSLALVKGDVGLGNVDNTADASKAFNASAINAGTLVVARGGRGIGTLGPVNGVQALTPGTTVAVDASLGTHFTLTPVQNFTLSNPTNAVNSQLLLFAIRQDATGSRVITLDTKFRFGTDITTVVLTTTPAKTDYLGVRYHSGDDKFDVIMFIKGF